MPMTTVSPTAPEQGWPLPWVRDLCGAVGEGALVDILTAPDGTSFIVDVYSSRAAGEAAALQVRALRGLRALEEGGA
jgi:hypothetical protein